MNAQKTPRVCIGILIYNKKREILLGRTYKWGNKWTCIGGGLEYGETLEGCAKREAKEETGLTISNIKFVGVQESVFSKTYHKRRHFVFIDFSAMARSNKVKLNDEFQEYKWVSLQTALRMNLNFSTKVFVKSYMDKKSSH